MVDMDKVFTRVTRGAFTAVGVLAADNVEDNLEEFFGVSGAGLNLAGAGIGLGASVFADEATDMVGMDRNGFVNDMIEYGGYGVQGASFNNLLENVVLETSSASTGGDVIRVDSHAGRQTDQTVEEPVEDQEDELLLETV